MAALAAMVDDETQRFHLAVDKDDEKRYDVNRREVIVG